MDRDHLHNQIIREIIARVAAGTYAVGERLPAERALCDEFEVARGTLRKALATLGELGVLKIKANSGIYVQGMPKSRLPRTLLPPDLVNVNLRDIIEARKAIELAALRQAVGRISARELRELKALLADMTAAIEDLPGFLELDLAFHQKLVRASGNAVLATAFEAIYDYHRFSAVYTSQHEGEEAEALRYHERLIAAIEARDVRASRRILEQHLNAVCEPAPAPNGRAARRAALPGTKGRT